jgi:hypothetical protein
MTPLYTEQLNLKPGDRVDCGIRRRAIPTAGKEPSACGMGCMPPNWGSSLAVQGDEGELERFLAALVTACAEGAPSTVYTRSRSRVSITRVADGPVEGGFKLSHGRRVAISGLHVDGRAG